mmetsp:Transcript_8315/g.23847  ORF Transcript_8315/g.23847 Transcript_8315/m.23847 type:complete len:283 (+) Transcript_8315:1465-2313(+)
MAQAPYRHLPHPTRLAQPMEDCPLQLNPSSSMLWLGQSSRKELWLPPRIPTETKPSKGLDLCRPPRNHRPAPSTRLKGTTRVASLQRHHPRQCLWRRRTTSACSSRYTIYWMPAPRPRLPAEPRTAALSPRPLPRLPPTPSQPPPQRIRGCHPPLASRLCSATPRSGPRPLLTPAACRGMACRRSRGGLVRQRTASTAGCRTSFAASLCAAMAAAAAPRTLPVARPPQGCSEALQDSKPPPPAITTLTRPPPPPQPPHPPACSPQFQAAAEIAEATTSAPQG